LPTGESINVVKNAKILFLLAILGQIAIAIVVLYPMQKQSIFVAELCCIALVWLWISLIRRQHSDLLSPSPWILVWFVIVVITIPLVMAIFGYTFYVGVADYLPAAILLSSHGFAGFVIGYYMIPQKWPSISVSFGSWVLKKSKIKTAFVVVVILYVGVLAYAILFGLNTEAFANQIWIGLVIPAFSVSWAFTFCLMQQRKRVLLVGLLVFLVPAYIITVRSGNVVYTKEGLFQLFLFPVIAGYILTGRASWNTLLLFAIVLLLAFALAFPIVEFARGQQIKGDEVALLDAVINLINDFPSARWEYIVSRLNLMEYLAGLVANAESSNPKQPDDPLWILVGPLVSNVPSFLWPDKPTGADYAILLGVQLGVFTLADSSSLAVTVVGHLLWVGGYGLIFVPMLLLGTFTAACYRLFSYYTFHSGVYVMFYLGCLLTFFRIESTVNQYLTFPIRMVVLAWLMHTMVRGSVRSPERHVP
jgi:hypothetical protein